MSRLAKKQQQVASAPCADVTSGRGGYGKPDGVVNVEDLLVVLSLWGSTPTTERKQMDIVYQQGSLGKINIEVRMRTPPDGPATAATPPCVWSYMRMARLGAPPT